MLNKKQLSTCKSLLLERKSELRAHLEGHFGMEVAHARESVGELSNYDNHPGDTATELYEREKDIALNEHAEEELKNINKALEAINDQKYGTCEVCGNEISYDRLEAVPATLRCVEHAEKNIDKTRPVEEDVIGADITQTNNDNSTIFDTEDAWQAVSQYGSSETPSDFMDTEKSYQDMYYDSGELSNGPEAIDGFLLTDSEGNYIGVNEKHEQYESYLDENRADSIT
ncbi:YteA family regulatory protein [Natronobacillus azotifigens]|uniref:TraR/DksA C4-type zinc finger protein n=1 Tax=Natronobacillus azotifigens TaxID=472978 RepID=A0A9J6REN0_9BACI|nr:TraR/DksA C4-type zinc finger protein [Natronobacillus azotifigens]MCZ0704210.1 TraR/DksA C4-type zinc finger protein [Natronobacillus azotifigens]